MALVSVATATKEQVTILQSVFQSFGKTFYIRKESERGETVMVYLYADSCGRYTSSGWDQLKAGEQAIGGFAYFLEKCKQVLAA